MDPEDRRQSSLSIRRDAVTADRDTGLRIQITYQHRPAVRVYPRGYGDIGLGTGRPTAQAGGDEEHQLIAWTDSAYRSKKNEKWLADLAMTSRIRRRKPAGRPMPQATARANAKKPSIRAAVEHVFAHQKMRFGLIIRTVGLARAEAKLTQANLAYNFDRLISHERRAAMG